MKSGIVGRSGGSHPTQPARFEGGLGLAGQQLQNQSRAAGSSSSPSSRPGQQHAPRQDSGSNGSASMRTVNGYADRTEDRSTAAADASRTTSSQQRPLVADRKAPPPPRAPQQADPSRKEASQPSSDRYATDTGRKYPEEKTGPKPSSSSAGHVAASISRSEPTWTSTAPAATTALQPAKKMNNGPPPAASSGAAGRTEAERAAPPAPTTRTAERRISTMSEAQIMDKLRAVVSKDDPSLLYSKIKKVGQG